MEGVTALHLQSCKHPTVSQGHGAAPVRLYCQRLSIPLALLALALAACSQGKSDSLTQGEATTVLRSQVLDIHHGGSPRAGPMRVVDEFHGVDDTGDVHLIEAYVQSPAMPGDRVVYRMDRWLIVEPVDDDSFVTANGDLLRRVRR